MAISDTEVVIIGGGAAGIAAARRLREAAVALPAGRGAAAARRPGLDRDERPDTRSTSAAAGCIPPTAIRGARSRSGRAAPSTRPRRPGSGRRSRSRFPLAEQRDYFIAQHAFDERARRPWPSSEPDRPPSAFLEPGGRWNALIDAVSTYYSGAELERVSARDLARYQEDDANWRVVGGLGAAVAAYGAGLPVDAGLPGAAHRPQRQARSRSKPPKAPSAPTAPS